MSVCYATPTLPHGVGHPAPRPVTHMHTRQAAHAHAARSLDSQHHRLPGSNCMLKQNTVSRRQSHDRKALPTCPAHLLDFGMAGSAGHAWLEDCRKILVKERVHLVAAHHRLHTLARQQLKAMLHMRREGGREGYATPRGKGEGGMVREEA